MFSRTFFKFFIAFVIIIGIASVIAYWVNAPGNTSGIANTADQNINAQ